MPDIDFSNLYNGQVSISKQTTIGGAHVGYNNAGNNYPRFGFILMEDGSYQVLVQSGKIQNDISTVEAIQNYLGVHEYWGHGVQGYSGGSGQGTTHWKAYDAQLKHPTFHKLSSAQQTEIRNRVQSYK